MLSGVFFRIEAQLKPGWEVVFAWPNTWVGLGECRRADQPRLQHRAGPLHKLSSCWLLDCTNHLLCYHGYSARPLIAMRYHLYRATYQSGVGQGTRSPTKEPVVHIRPPQVVQRPKKLFGRPNACQTSYKPCRMMFVQPDCILRALGESWDIQARLRSPAQVTCASVISVTYSHDRINGCDGPKPLSH